MVWRIFMCGGWDGSHINRSLPGRLERIATTFNPRAEPTLMVDSYVILGDGIAGSSAAETLRDEAPEADITIVTDEGEPLYNRILIKEFAKGKLPEAPISIHSMDWYEDREIDLRLNTLVTAVDTDENVLRTHEREDIAYDKLLLATGGAPAQLPAENSDAEGIHHFWTFQDARRIREHAAEAESGVIVGAGLLGIDLAAICGTQELDAHYLMRGDRWWRYALSDDGAEIIHEAMRGVGVTPVFGASTEGFETDEEGHITAAVTDDGERYDADFAGVAIGLNFNTEYLQGSEIDVDAGIPVDEYMYTGTPDVYAAGDITRFWDTITDARQQNGSWGSAKQQGTVAAQNMVADTDAGADGRSEGREDRGTEAFRWVSSYSITHFEFPFLSFGFPTIGDESAERKYSESEWRRLAFKDGKLVGGVLIGDLSPQSGYKRLIQNEMVCADQTELLLQQSFDPEQLAAPQEQ
jgi:NAD(P)H-nitrite reductase large subunit